MPKNRNVAIYKMNLYYFTTHYIFELTLVRQFLSFIAAKSGKKNILDQVCRCLVFTYVQLE